MNFAIEGYSFAGKTDFVNRLTSDYTDIVCIAEHDIYAQGINNYPSFPNATVKEAEENVDFFYNLELMRCRDAIAALKNGKLPVFDRSIFSVILFQMYVQSLQLETHFTAPDYAKAKAIELIDRQEIVVPDAIIHLHSSLAIITQRRSREISVDLLRNDSAYEFFGRQYNMLRDIYAKYGRSISIRSKDDANDTSTQIDTVAQQLRRWSQEKDYTAISAQTMAKEFIASL